jgi:hypothetical protein
MQNHHKESDGRKEVKIMKYVAPSYMVAESVGDVDSLVTPPAYAVVAIIVIVALVAGPGGCTPNPP